MSITPQLLCLALVNIADRSSGFRSVREQSEGDWEIHSFEAGGFMKIGYTAISRVRRSAMAYCTEYSILCSDTMETYIKKVYM